MNQKHSEYYYQNKLKNNNVDKYKKYLMKKRKERFNLLKEFLRSNIDLFIEKSNFNKLLIKKVENINSGLIISEHFNAMEELINNINSGNASQKVFECYSHMFSEYLCFKLLQRSLEVEKKKIITNKSEFMNKCKHFIIFNDPKFNWNINLYRIFEKERIISYNDYIKGGLENINREEKYENELRIYIDGYGGVGFSDDSFIIEYDDEQIPHDDEMIIKFLNNKLSIIIKNKFENYFNSKVEFRMPFDIKINGEIIFLKENE